MAGKPQGGAGATESLEGAERAEGPVLHPSLGAQPIPVCTPAGTGSLLSLLAQRGAAAGIF